MKNFFSDIANQLWTLLGMFIAWVVLDGSAKTVVGYAIVGSTVIWAITFKLRNLKDE
jgi:ABC-type uncharacterized transport system fused permease/ATPase subunit